MRTNYRTLLYSTAFCLIAGFSSCSDETDLGGSLQEIQTISSITLNQTAYNADVQNLYMLPNQEIQLSCTVLPEEANDKSVKWTSQNETVAVVSADGYLVTKNVGTTVVRVTPGIGFGPSATTPSFTINVVDHFNYIEEITLKNTDILVTEGISESASYQVEVDALPATATFKRYKWESLNPEIAAVDDSGVVTGVKAGTATIKVTADDFSASPVSTTFTVKINPVIQIENFEFTDEAKEYLGQLGYGEVYDLKKSVALTPSNATVELISWSSDNASVASVDEDGVLTVHSMLSGSATITASTGELTKTVSVNVAEGRIWYSFENGIGDWSLESGNNSSVVKSDGEKTTIKMGASDKYRGDFVWVRNGVSQTKITPSVYRYLAMKINVASPLSAGSNANGCIKLELWDDSGDKGTIGNNYTGAVNSANNSFEVLNGGSFQTTAPNVIYWDLQSNYDKHTPTDWNQTFTLNCLKFVIADYTATDSYDIYWVRSFKTVEELEAFVVSEDTNK